MNELAKTVRPMDQFQAQIIERLRDDIRDLLPEAALADLVKRAVDETFFQERRIDRGYGNFDVKASWFVESVTKSAEPMLRAAVDSFIASKQDVIERAIAQFLTHERLTVLVADRLAERLSDQFERFLANLTDRAFR